jgi:hypothetical protein
MFETQVSGSILGSIVLVADSRNGDGNIKETFDKVFDVLNSKELQEEIRQFVINKVSDISGGRIIAITNFRKCFNRHDPKYDRVWKEGE